MRITLNNNMPDWLSKVAEDIDSQPVPNNSEKKDMGTYSFGECPDNVITKASLEQYPGGYRMEIKSQEKWKAISDAVNVGIDGYLEGFTKSSFDDHTGKCNIHPEELHILLRRLFESESNESWSLRSDILSTLGIEEI